jgi:hypothetical protein
MGELGMNVFLQIVSWLVVPVVGFFVVLFLGKPFSRFYDLRNEIGETLGEYDNVLPTETDRMIAAQTLFRRLGTKMSTLADHHRLTVWVLQKRGYNPSQAGSALIGLSNTMQPGEGKHLFKTQIRRTLRLRE